MKKYLIKNLWGAGIIPLSIIAGAIIGIFTTWQAGVVIGLVGVAFGIVVVVYNTTRGVNNVGNIASDLLDQVTEVIHDSNDPDTPPKPSA